MSQKTPPAVLKLLEQSQRVAIFPSTADDLDSVAAAIALAKISRASGHDTTIYSGGKTNGSLSFLNADDFIKASFEVSRELIISVPTEKTGLASLSYRRVDHDLQISVSPKHGTFEPSRVIARSDYSNIADLIVVIGSPSLQALGDRFTENAELFYQVPVISIDYHAESERYGKANWVDWSARSSCELIYSLYKDKPGAITRSVASALLAGVLTSSESFQKEMTSPHEFELAAHLMELGADRQKVVSELYRSKPLKHLKLSGLLLENLKQQNRGEILTTHLSRSDFKSTGTRPEILPAVIRSLLASSTQAKLVGIAYELEPGLTGLFVAAPSQISAQALLEHLAITTSKVRNISGTFNEAHCLIDQEPLELVENRFLLTCELFLKPRYTEQHTNAQRKQDKEKQTHPRQGYSPRRKPERKATKGRV